MYWWCIHRHIIHAAAVIQIDRVIAAVKSFAFVPKIIAFPLANATSGPKLSFVVFQKRPLLAYSFVPGALLRLNKSLAAKAPRVYPLELPARR